MGFSVVLFVDAISRETVDSKKLVAMTAASVFMIFVSLNPNMISTCTSSWGLSLCMEEDLRIVVSIVGFLISVFLIFYSIKIHLVAPKNLKVHSKWFLIGMFLIGVVGSLSVITELTLIIPAIDQLIMAIGACICAWVMAVQPKLAYILPFKVYRLMVMETEKGTPLYVYDWIRSDVELNNELFSRMFHAMNKITEKSMQSNIREIHLDQDIFIIQRSTQFEVVCLLVTSKSSQFLRDALNSFAKKFFTKFSNLLSNPSKEDDFESASELIHEHFAFVP